MHTQNDKQDKAAFHANYYGQNIAAVSDRFGTSTQCKIDSFSIGDIDYIELLPLSSQNTG